MKTTVAAVSLAVLCVLLAGATSAAAQANRRTYFPDPTTLTGGGTIGVSVRDLTADEVRNAKLTEAGGVIVTVADGSEAARAGFQNGDLVIEFDGERVRSARQFTRLVQESAIGRPVKALILRDGSRRTIDVTPRAGNVFGFTEPIDWSVFAEQVRPLARGFTRELGIPALVAPDTFASPRRLGATLATLNEQLGSYFGATTGALVLSVSPRSAAETAGLKGGDVIAAVNGRAVRRPIEVAEAVRDAGADQRLELKVIREKKEITLTVPLAP